MEKNMKKNVHIYIHIYTYIKVPDGAHLHRTSLFWVPNTVHTTLILHSTGISLLLDLGFSQKQTLKQELWKCFM